ncbi:MAG: c-type cytochrome [Solirubrobacteraceae bacterium]
MIVGFVILWVLLALVVIFVAMQRGSRGARESLYGESRPLRIAIQLGIIAVFAFGIAVPALVLAFNGEHKVSVGPGGLRLNVAEQKGRVLFSQTCAFCHTLKAAGAVGRTGPDLDALIVHAGTTADARKAFVLSSIEAGFAGRYGQMPPAIYSGHEAEDVAAFVAASAGH